MTVTSDEKWIGYDDETNGGAMNWTMYDEDDTKPEIVSLRLDEPVPYTITEEGRQRLNQGFPEGEFDWVKSPIPKRSEWDDKAGRWFR